MPIRTYTEEPAIGRQPNVTRVNMSPLRDFSQDHPQKMATTSTINFLDDTYARMKKSADRIAAVLGIDRPKLDNDLRGDRNDASRGRSPGLAQDHNVRSV